MSPDDSSHDYFFGYYDKSPWDATDRYMLCMRANDTWSDVSPKEKADILIIDTEKNEDNPKRIRKVAETHAWNVQQGCMLQWLGPDFGKRILYNDYRNGAYCSIILDLETMKERIIPVAVYSVASDGKTALTLDFSRLYNLRPGYGYYNVPEKTKGVELPNTTAIWKVNLENCEVTDLLKYTAFSRFQPRDEMLEDGAVHKVNHIMISPNGERFLVLYRWFNGKRKYTRLITCNIDGTDMYVLSDDDMVSHCCWKDDETILAFENKYGTGSGYYLMKDKTQEYIHCWPQFSNDGHPSYSPDRSLIVIDSYPDRARVASINIMDGDEGKKENKTIAKVFSPFKYDNDTRCDLHPRWNREGSKVCFDAVFEGHRGMYVVDIGAQKNIKAEKEKYTVTYVFTSCKRCGPIQVMYNLIKNIDRNQFNIVLITIYDEVEGESELEKFISFGVKHYRVPLSKIDIILNNTKKLKNLLIELNPSIIHSMGVFPDYAVSRMQFNCQVITLHNYMHEDFYAKFGLIQGFILETMQMSAVKRATKVWTCSKSLSQIYEKNNRMHFDYIRNGVDVKKYSRIKNDFEKIDLRKRLNLYLDKIIFIYTGQFIERKDQEFLLELFTQKSELKNYVLLLLGDGIKLDYLKEKFGQYNNIVFTGNVKNVADYLKASDFYISSSHSEGLPVSVLEGMSAGLPVILSNIIQHIEIIEIDSNMGVVFELGDKSDCEKKIIEIIKKDRREMSNAAYKCAHNYLDDVTMSKNYQNEYMKVIKNSGV